MATSKLGILGLAGVALLAVSPFAAAHSVSGSYTIGATPVLSLLCSPCLAPGVNVGGVTFPPAGSAPMHVDIADTTGSAVGYTVCQDANGDGLCGNGGDPNVAGCGTSVDLPSGFAANLPLNVFVRIADQSCVGDVATTGTVTVNYAA